MVRKSVLVCGGQVLVGALRSESNGRGNEKDDVQEPLLSARKNSEVELSTEFPSRSNSRRTDRSNSSMGHGGSFFEEFKEDHLHDDSMSVFSLDDLRDKADDVGKSFLDAISASGDPHSVVVQVEFDGDQQEEDAVSALPANGSYRPMSHHTVESSECERMPQRGRFHWPIIFKMIGKKENHGSDDLPRLASDRSHQQSSSCSEETSNRHTVISSECERMERPVERGPSVLLESHAQHEDESFTHETPGVAEFVTRMVSSWNRDEMKTLTQAILDGNFKVVHQVLDRSNIDVNQPVLGRSTVLAIACESGNSAIVEQLLMRAEINVNKQSEDGATPLHLACVFGQTDVVGLLLDHPKINIHSFSSGGYAPLHLASHNGFVKVVGMFLGVDGVDVNLPTRKNRYTPLYLAARNGQMEIVSILLAQTKINVNERSNTGNTALHGACFGGHEQIGMMVVRAGVDVNLQTVQGVTPLHLCVHLRRKDIAQFLLGCENIKVNEVDDQSRTALDVAVLFKRWDIAMLIIASPSCNATISQRIAVATAYRGLEVNKEPQNVSKTSEITDNPSTEGTTTISSAQATVRSEHEEMIDGLLETLLEQQAATDESQQNDRVHKIFRCCKNLHPRMMCVSMASRVSIICGSMALHCFIICVLMASCVHECAVAPTQVLFQIFVKTKGCCGIAFIKTKGCCGIMAIRVQECGAGTKQLLLRLFKKTKAFCVSTNGTIFLVSVGLGLAIMLLFFNVQNQKIKS